LNKYIDRITERELILQYQTKRNSENETERQQANNALEKLLDAHNDYIHKIACKEYKVSRKQVEFEDLMQEGRIGLIKAINNFDLNRITINPVNQKIVSHQALLTYATNFIRSEMQTLWHRSQGAHIPAYILQSIQFDKVNSTSSEAIKSLAKKSMHAYSLDEYKKDYNGGLPIENYIKIDEYSANKDSTFYEATRQIYSKKVKNVIQKLNQEEWEIVQLKLGLKPEQEGVVSKNRYIATQLQLPEEYIDKVFKKVRRVFLRYLKKDYHS